MIYNTDNIKSYNGIVYPEDVQMLVQENQRRMENIFGQYDPLTGYNCYDFDNRVKVSIKDLYVPDVEQMLPMMYVLPDMFQNTMFKEIVHTGDIRQYLRNKHIPQTKENYLFVCKEICKMRCKADREFSMYIGDKIQDKKTGQMVRFRLNYPQRVLHNTIENLAKLKKGVYICLLKARQWGGSTYTQMRMKDIQDHVHDGWNAIIIAQGKKTAKKIKAMYKKAVQRQAGWILGQDGKKLQLSPYENSQDDFWVTDEKYNPIRRSILSVSAYEVVDADRGENYHMAHMSEVGVWKKTDEHDPEDVISSIMGGIDNIEDNLVVMESTGKKAYGFFYDTWKEAIDPKTPSLWYPLFIPFYIIEKDHTPLENETDEQFATWLLQHKDSSFNVEGYKETGKFFWRLWKLGADFQAINWYRINRNVARSHAIWATEAPIDPTEAFRTAGNLVFDAYAIDELRDKYVREPIMYADVLLKGHNYKELARDSVIKERTDHNGELEIWARPNNDIMRAKNRYLISVDIGGNSAKADFTVMTVIDRIGTIDGMKGRPETVARWRGHCRHDKLAWKALALAKYYDNALLVIESNTADRERYNNTEGDHFGTIIEVLADYYDNIYMRAPATESVEEKPLRKYGFQTNKLTKGYVIDNLIAAVEDETFVDPDRMLYQELSIYERREDGSLGNRPGANNHDDIVMSLAIGLYVSQFDCDKCDWKREKTATTETTKKQLLNEAAF